MLPSIPGFGFSGPTRETGWEHRRIAAAFAGLMRRLGYRRYGACGGDWGSVISRELGRAHPGQVMGVHLTVLPGSAADTKPDDRELAGLSAAERERAMASWQRSQQWDRDSAGYAAIQSTRPQTLAADGTPSREILAIAIPPLGSGAYPAQVPAQHLAEIATQNASIPAG